MSDANPSAELLNARYIAIRTAEAKGLTDRLFEASRDKTPGVRRMLVPLLYRYWHGNREKGWELIERIASGAIRFPGLVDRDAVEILGEVSMPILNASRGQPDDLARLSAIWQALMTRMLGSPLARTARVVSRTLVLKKAANSLAEVLKRQPIYQPVNYAEMEVTFARPDAFRAAWRDALGCLDSPETAPGPIEAILMRTDTPFDLYLMMMCERALIYYGIRTDPEAAFALLERLFHEGCPWFRGSILYALFHILSNQEQVEDSWLERYEMLAQEFFTSGAWRLVTSAGQYVMATMVANVDVVAARHRPGRAPRVVPALLEQAIRAGDEAGIEALFDAIDGVAFYHGNGTLALALLEAAQSLGGPARDQRVMASLASVRLLNQPLVDAVLEQRRAFARITAENVAGAEPSIAEEDLLTLLDGFIIHMLVTSDGFRGQLCGAFRRALTARSAPEFLLQILEWVRDEVGVTRRVKT